MRLHPLILAGALSLATSAAWSQSMFEGDTRLACEAILCLSSGNRPAACAPALSRYFGINLRRFSETIRARRNFLSLCPLATADGGMTTLVDAIANGAGRCDAAALNASGYNDLGVNTRISNVAPTYCTALWGHPNTDASSLPPKYIGTPEGGGRWVD